MAGMEDNGAQSAAAAIKAARERRGLSQPGLAREAGVSAAAVAKWEQGHRMPSSAEVVAALAEALGTTAEALHLVPPDFQTATLREIMRARRISRETVAQALGLPASAVREIDSGRRMPPDPDAWCALLEVGPRLLAESWVRSHERYADEKPPR